MIVIDLLTDFILALFRALKNILLVPYFILVFLFLIFVGIIGGTYQKVMADKWE